jgi:hypothetical protein
MVSLPRLPIDLGPDDPFLQRRSHEEAIDAHAKVSVKHAGAVVIARLAADVAVLGLQS